MDLTQTFNFLPPELAIFILAMLPVTELRGSIPIAVFGYNLNPFIAFIFSVLGNIVPAIFIVWLIGPISNFLKKHIKFFEKFFNWWFAKVEKKFSDKYKKYGMVALMLFVAIPLPVTGGWTGSVASWLFEIPKKSSLIYITLGLIISGIIVTTLTVGTSWIIS